MGKPTFRTRDTSRARTLRNTATPAERKLWTGLSGRRMEGAKFSRQMPVGPNFVDFLCRERKLAVELDGFSHEARASYDEDRTAWLETHGYRVLRFTNAEVMGNLEGVLTRIGEVLAARPEAHPRPLPQAGGEQVVQ